MPWRAAPLILLAAAPPAAPREQALMDLIERTVKLPPGARPMGQYARVYAYLTPSKVKGVWDVIGRLPGLNDRCERWIAANTSRPCTAREAKDSVPPEVGKRRWLGDWRNLPHLVDGGCGVVEIEYDIADRRYTNVHCNGGG